MSLRRLAKSLKEQNWTAIVIEFILLVSGVFLGIQVANWNADRIDQRLTQRYFADIASDIRSDLAELSRVEASAQKRISASTYLLQQAGIAETTNEIRLSDADVDDIFSGSTRLAIPALAPPPEREREYHLWEVVVDMYAFDMNRAAYDALIGSGKLELIDKPNIMRALREYYYLVNALDRTQSRSILPMHNFARELGIAHGLSNGIPVTERALLAKVKHAPPLIASIALTRRNAGLVLLLCKVQRQKGEELLKMLGSGQMP
jgi:hypothetical protein